MFAFFSKVKHPTQASVYDYSPANKLPTPGAEAMAFRTFGTPTNSAKGAGVPFSRDWLYERVPYLANVQGYFQPLPGNTVTVTVPEYDMQGAGVTYQELINNGLYIPPGTSFTM